MNNWKADWNDKTPWVTAHLFGTGRDPVTGQLVDVCHADDVRELEAACIQNAKVAKEWREVARVAVIATIAVSIIFVAVLFYI